MTVITPIRFKKRLETTKAAIEAQIQRAKPARRNPLRAKLWVRWINHKILSREAKS